MIFEDTIKCKICGVTITGRSDNPCVSTEFLVWIGYLLHLQTALCGQKEGP